MRCDAWFGAERSGAIKVPSLNSARPAAPVLGETMAKSTVFAKKISGTNRADTLAATAGGDRLFGLGGPDTLTSSFNHTVLSGGLGEDQLTTIVSVGGPNATSARAVAHQQGGGGDDRLSANSTATTKEGARPGAAVSAANVLGGGDGDDMITASSVADGYPWGDASNAVYGGAGSDVIDVFARGSLHGDNYAQGGHGDDAITGRAEGVRTSNDLRGGDGDDEIEATANSKGVSRNSLSGGNGDDDLWARSSAELGNAFSDFELTNRLHGGAGHDQLTISSSYGGISFRATEDSEVYGGSGDDLADVSLGGSGSTWSFADTRLYGEDGSDILNAAIAIEARQRAEARNALFGGAGDDELTAYAYAAVSEAGRSAFGVNRIEGGDGRDILKGTIDARSQGYSEIYGGGGADLLIVAGGWSDVPESTTQNRLYGGAGADEFWAGDRADFMEGGVGRDTFRFDTELYQGSDTIADFDRALDRLFFFDFDDRGPAGKVDDLDAISTIADAGAGGDVTVTFDSGSVIVFAGVGTGTTSSFADLVDDPLTQLLG